MRKQRHFARLFFCLSIGLLLSIAHRALAAEPSSAGQTTIAIGRVSDNPKKHYKEFKPFIDYLARQLAPLGIREGKVVFTKDNHELIGHLRNGTVDIVSETPFSSLLYMDQTGAKILLRRWKNVSSRYSSIIFARKDSGIHSLEELKGKKIAFEDPGSTSGYLLPKAVFKQKGIEMVELKSLQDPVPPDKVGYLFAGGEINLTHWVHRGMAAAGALSDLEFRDPEEVPESFLPDFQPLYESIFVPRNLILVRAGMDPRLEEAIKQVLLSMKDEEDGQVIMRKFNKTSNFDELPGGSDEALREVRKLYELIREDILKSS